MLAQQQQPAFDEARFSALDSRVIHRLKIELAKLVAGLGSTGALNQLRVAEQFLAGQVGRAELLDARQDAWAQAGSLACYCSRADFFAGQSVLTCLEADPAAHTPKSLSEQCERALQAGVTAASAAQVLATAL